MHFRLYVASVLIGSAIGFAGVDLVRAQTAEQWRADQMAAAEKSEKIMREAGKRKGLLAQYKVMLRAAYAGDKNPAFPVIFGQYLSWYQTYVGDYPNAEASFSIQEVAQDGDHPSPLADKAWHARPALDVIPRLAHDRRIVLLNEAHHIALTRTLTVQLLTRLRQEGFDYFAAETLYQSDGQLQARGYPIEDSGFYTYEPICAEMVRTALKLGFKVVAYEAETSASGDQREARQARNLYERVFKNDPHARLVVDAGYAHIVEEGPYLGGSSMAEDLAKLTGIDPLTVEQTALIPHPASNRDHPYYTAVMQQLHPDAPIVFVRDDGTPWTLRKGYDVNVWFPPPQMRHGRPTWLALGGLRKPYFVAGDLACDRHYPCLVEARYADEGADAIPADRLLFDPPSPYMRGDHVRPAQGATSADLYLRPGTYKLSISDDSGRVFSRRVISVGTGPGSWHQSASE